MPDMREHILKGVVNITLRAIIRLLCKIEGDFDRVPLEGPLIMAVNHVNFMDAPLMATHLPGRPLTVLAKEETWDNLIIGSLFTIWGGIPIKRGQVDRKAFLESMQALKEGKILAIAPEGTRSGTGSLNKGYPGIVIIAQQANVPILPVALFGGECFWSNLKKLKRTHFQFRVGTPFYLVRGKEQMDKEERQEVADEIMHQIAQLMPAQYHGVYEGSVNDPPKHIQFNMQNMAIGSQS